MLTCLSCCYYRSNACHRRPPLEGGFPAVTENDWCGEYRRVPFGGEQGARGGRGALEKAVLRLVPDRNHASTFTQIMGMLRDGRKPMKKPTCYQMIRSLERRGLLVREGRAYWAATQEVE